MATAAPNRPAFQASTTPTAPIVKETPLVQMSMKMASEQILLNLFRRFQGTRPDLEERLQAAYKEKYGREMRKAGSRDVRAIYLEGEPGHGKTTTHREACREFAALMKMKFMDEPSLSQMQRGLIDKNTFVFSTLTVAGATSKHEVGGLMAKMKIGDQEFMGHLPDWRMAATMMGGFGYVFFDDFVTSSHQVQNACLDLLLGGSAGDFQFNAKDMAASEAKITGGKIVNGVKEPIQLEFVHNQEAADKLESLNAGQDFRGASPVHVGLAGNRGARDGNKIFPLTTATITRVQRMDVMDTVDEWVKRAEKRYPDPIGAAHYDVYMKTHSEYFSAIAQPTNGITSSMPCPRTHDACMDGVGTLVHNYGGFAALMADEKLRDRFIADVEDQAGMHIGTSFEVKNKQTQTNEVMQPATSLSGFYTELLLGALPRAEEIIKAGHVDEEFIKTKYNDGHGMDGKNFGYQFCSALATLAAAAVSERVKAEGSPKKGLEGMCDKDSTLSTDVRETMRNFSYGLCMLQKPMVGYAIDKFLNRLNALNPELFEGNGAYRVPNEGILSTLLYGMVKDNKKYPDQVKDLRTTYADSLSQATNGYLDGIDKTIEEGISKRKDLLSNALKAGLT